MPFAESIIRLCYRHRCLQLAVGILFSLLLGGLASLWRGPDHGFDNMNYHIYNAWAFLNNRFSVDLYTAEFRTYFSPFVELPYYFLAFKWFPESPRVVAFIMGLPAGVLFTLTFLLISKTLEIFREIKCTLRYFYSFLFSFFGLSGISVVSQIGYTSNEIPVACCITGGLLAFVHFRKHTLTAALLSGILFGTATGLKLTAHVFVIPFLLGLLLFHTSWKERIKAVFVFCIAWWAAFLLLFGWWGWTLYQLTGNPIFPGMNNIFHSDWIPPNNGMDNRFTPHKLRHILFFPFYWVERAIVTDDMSTDIRFLYAYSVAGVAAIFYALRLALHFFVKHLPQFITTRILPRKKNVPVVRFLPRDERSNISFFFFGFVVFSYIIWEYQFSILRYAIPVESLLGLFVFLCISPFFRIQNHPGKHILITSIVTFFVLSALITDKHERPRVAFRATNQKHDLPRLPKNTLIINFPGTSFLAPALTEKNPTVTFVAGLFENFPSGPPKTWRETGIFEECGVKNKIREKIAANKNSLRVLAHESFNFSDPKINEKCTQYHVIVQIKNAETLNTSFGVFKLYPAEYNTTIP